MVIIFCTDQRPLGFFGIGSRYFVFKVLTAMLVVIFRIRVMVMLDRTVIMVIVLA